LFDNCFDRLRQLVSQHPPDLLLQDALCHPSLWGINRRLKSIGDFPIVAIVHQVLSRRIAQPCRALFHRLIEKRYLASVDAFIYNSRNTQKAVEAMVGGQKPALVAVPGGDRLGQAASAQWISLRSGQKGPLRMVFLANVLPDKGLHRLLEILSKLADPIWQLNVVGDLGMDPAYVQRIMRAVATGGLTDRVFFSGTKNGSELAEILNDSHVLVLPFSHEGFGIAFVEGMAFGLPALGSTQGAAGETIRHGHNGFLVAPGDAQALIDAIRLLFANRRRLTQMSLNASANFRQHPKWDVSMAAVEAFLHRLATKGSIRARGQDRL
jgi:glycosyltransferase involved in cell wall biosynthesis